MFEEGYISKEDLEKNKKLPLDAMRGKDLKLLNLITFRRGSSHSP